MLASRPFAGIDIKLEVVDIVDFLVEHHHWVFLHR